MFGNNTQNQDDITNHDNHDDTNKPGDLGLSASLGSDDTPPPVPGTAPSFSLPSSPPPTDLPAPTALSSTDDDTAADTPVSVPGDELLSLKQAALKQLTPLVGHLEQTPEEKFRTTMMMIQAADDQSLIKTAYDAAKAIPDEKIRAQALLDVVNEINYFTQQQK